MPSKLQNKLKRLSVKLGFERDWYLVMIAAVIGLVMGGVATAFILPLRWIENWGEKADPNLLLILVPIAPILGVLLASIVVRTLRGESVPGVSAVIYAVHRQKSRLPLSVAARKWIASTLTIGSGGSAGAEGPIVTIGASIGSSLARLLKVDTQQTAALLGCGAAAGIASVFNAPIAGIFFVMEVLLRDFSIRTFTPIVISAVVSSAWTRTILGEEDPLFLVKAEFFSELEVFTINDIPNYLLLGLVCGAVAVGFIRLLIVTESFFERTKLPVLLRPSLGAMLLGVLGLLYLFMATPEHPVPPFYGNGYPVIKELLLPENYQTAGEGMREPMMLLLFLFALVVLKCVATCLTIGSGGSGGLFAPSLLIGAAVGGLFGHVINIIGLFEAASPAQYALVGMAAMLAATSHAPLTGILIVYEVTLRYELILPLMLTAVISSIVGRLLYKESVYTFKLAQMGVRVGAMSDLTILRRLYVHDVKLSPAVVVRKSDSAYRLIELAEKHLAGDFVVVDEFDHYAGMVTRDDLAAALVYREAIPLLQVHELLRSDLPTVTADESLDVVLDKFSTHDAHSLAVMDENNGKLVRGLISRSRLMERYQNALSRD